MMMFIKDVWKIHQTMTKRFLISDRRLDDWRYFIFGHWIPRYYVSMFIERSVFLILCNSDRMTFVESWQDRFHQDGGIAQDNRAAGGCHGNPNNWT